MFYWIYDFPSLAIAALFSVVFLTVLFLAIFIVRYFFRSWLDSETGANEMVQFAFSNFFVLYGLLLGLLAVASYQNYSDAGTLVTKEAASLTALYRDLRGYQGAQRARLQEELRDYTRYLIGPGWTEQQQGIVSPEGAHRVAQFMDELRAVTPSNQGEGIIHAETLRQMNNYVELRQARLSNIALGIPPVLWWVVGLGSLISLILIAMLSMEIYLHLVLGSLISVFLGSMVFVIAATDNPFRGEVSVGPEAFRETYETLMKPNDAVVQSIQYLIFITGKLGAPKLQGTVPVAGIDVPGLYFGETLMNGIFDVVDEVTTKKGGTVTLFVKTGDQFVRVTTNVKKADGTRAVGTTLDPKGPVIEVIRKGSAYYGEATILGKPYMTAYEPIRDASANIIGVYYVGYLQ